MTPEDIAELLVRAGLIAPCDVAEAVRKLAAEMSPEEETTRSTSIIDDRDQENPFEFSEDYDWSKWDFDNDPDWR